MKKICLIILAAAMLLGVCSCGSTPAEDTTGTEPGTPMETEPAATEAETTEEGTVTDIYPPAPTVTVPESIKILAIGNSFSSDCTEYLWKMLQNAGVKKITVGNLYYGGCAMSQHLSFATADSAVYTYYKSTKGSWVTTKNYKMSQALADEDWDIITLQESSKVAGIETAYKASLEKLVDYVRSKNSTATLVWNMTWAYQSDSTHSAFPNYNCDQMKMYTMITSCVEKFIEKESRFSYIIPMATAIQNARTSYLGDHLTRDGYHLNKDFGRYLAALCWTCKITGLEPSAITYNPASYVINEDMVAVAREAVSAALKTPYAVTESTIKTGKGSLAVASGETVAIDPTEILNPEDFFEADLKIASENGVNLNNYTLFKWDYQENGYWYCTNNTGIRTPGSTAATYHQNVCTKTKYSLDEIPLGSIFICDSGWQYRFEIYTNPNTVYTGKRPELQSYNFFTLTSDFMLSAKYLAWNVSSNPKSDISAIYAQAAAHIRVYVPNK